MSHTKSDENTSNKATKSQRSPVNHIFLFITIFTFVHVFIYGFVFPTKNEETTSLPKHMIKDSDLNSKREAVKQAFLHGWNGYSKYAFGFDEIKPVSNKSIDSYGKFGVTIIDSIDTMLLMNLKAPYEQARHFVQHDMKIIKDEYVNIFETTIRVIGGLLGAYTLSKDEIFIEKGKEVTDALLQAFKSPKGIPYTEINLLTGHARNRRWHIYESILSEIGSIQLEFKYLSHLTKDEKYKNIANNIMYILKNLKKKREGLYPCYIHTEGAYFTKSHISFGALGDSFYEYLLKQWLLTGKSEKMFKDMYDESIRGLKKYLLSSSSPSNLLYVSEMIGDIKIPKFDHLACFVPGMIALGTLHNKSATEDLHLAKELLITCRELYKRTKTGIGPEIVYFDNHVSDFNIRAPTYLLRPEYAESLFILYRVTGDKIYQEWAWEFFLSIEKYCKTKSAYSTIDDVNSANPVQTDGMQSFFFGETLKYLYLIFSPKDVLPLDEYVFNTEAHPFKIFKE